MVEPPTRTDVLPGSVAGLESALAPVLEPVRRRQQGMRAVRDSERDNIDGRTARRDRNRETVLDAMIDLIDEGTVLPSVDQISERSGVSHRSVFRYFEDLDGLFDAAVLRTYERVAPLSAIHNFGRGTMIERVDALVEQRVRLFGALMPLANAARHRKGAITPAETALKHHLAALRDQLEGHLAPQLADATMPLDALVDALDLTLSFGGYEYLRMTGRSEGDIRTVYRQTVLQLLR